MGDIFCKKCGEPWDYYGLLHEDATTKEEGKRILKGEGCPCCGFGATCIRCDGTGKEPEEYSDCELCFGKRRILVRKCPNANDKRWHNWCVGYLPNVYFNMPQPKELIEGYQCADGYVYQGWANCPKCWEKAPICEKCKGTGKYQEEDHFEEWGYSIVSEVEDDPIQYLME